MSWGSVLANQSKKIRADQHRRKFHRGQLVAMPDSNSSSRGSAGSRISLRVTERDDSKSDISPFCGPFPHQRIGMVSSSLSYVGFLKNWFVVSTKFLADDDVVVEASAAAVSWIADVIMVQQLGKPFALMGNNSLFVDFDGQVPRERAVDLPPCVGRRLGLS